MNAKVDTFITKEQNVLDVFYRHLAAFTSGDLDAVLEDFGKDSVVITPEGVFEGLQQIRKVFEGLLAEFGVIDRGDSPGFTFDIVQPCRDMLFITWNAVSKHHVFPFGTDTFVIRGDTIHRQTFSYPVPVAKQG
jgi:hypothetical protein